MKAESIQRAVTAINVPDVSPKDDPFVNLGTASDIEWVRLSGLPSNLVERRMKILRLSRYRAALQAARVASHGSVLISHLPLMTAAVSHAMALLNRRVPHLGFAFNFTQLPTGKRLNYLRRGFRRVDQFTIFSQYEQMLYAELFEIEPSRLKPVIWTQGPPPVQHAHGLTLTRPYLCAIGGEGRDFALLLEVARRLGPSVTMVIIARPDSLAGMAVPDNVVVLTNIPLAFVWGIASGSRGVLLPLRSLETCCGHITLVSAKLLGLPLATTRAHATVEYVEGRDAVLTCEPGDIDAFTNLAVQLLDEPDTLRAKAGIRMAREFEFHDRRHWAAHIDEFISANLDRI